MEGIMGNAESIYNNTKQVGCFIQNVGMKHQHWKGSKGHIKDKSRYYETWHKHIRLMHIKFPSKQTKINNLIAKEMLNL